MGCDIHLTAEYRNANGEWQNDDLTTEPDEYGDTTVHNRGGYHDRVYSGRNYDLFAILADVRNGLGFAGSDTGDGFRPIDSPRGVPADATDSYRQWVDQWAGDGHSHSWFTVSELMAYDWTQTSIKRGWVDVREWARFKTQGQPKEWSSMISGGTVTHHEEADFARAWAAFRLAEGRPDTHRPWHLKDDELAKLALLVRGQRGNPVCQVSWSIPYYEAGREFLSATLPKLWRLGKSDDVRICFFFDN